MRIARVLACFLILVIPMYSASAAAPGETAWFENSASTKYFDIWTIQFTRIAREYVMIDILITTPEFLTEEEKDAISSVSFYWLTSPDDQNSLERLIAKAPATSTNASVGSEIMPSECYEIESQWMGVSELPEILYLQPFYEKIGEWGEVIVLNRKDAETFEFEDLKNIKPPLTDGEGRANTDG